MPIKAKFKTVRWLLAIFIVNFLFFGIIPDAFGTEDDISDINKAIEELNNSIADRKEKTKELEKQKKVYEENIAKQKNKILDIKEELSFLNNKIEDTENTIGIYEFQIQKSKLEIEELESKINARENEIGQYKENIAEFIRQIHQYDQKSYLEILALNDSISEFFSQIQYMEDFQDDLRDILEQVKSRKEELENQQEELKAKKNELNATKDSLEGKNARLEVEKTVQGVLLKQTQGQEKKFKALLAEIQKESKEINAEISGLEEAARKKMAEKMAREGRKENFGESGRPPFFWPVPLQKITAYFHDPDYSYRRWIGEHSGIDLRSAQGSNVRAAGTGYVAKAKNGGRWGYSYVLLIHDGGFSTIYGHVSKLLVKEGDYVSRGQIIALSGGTPGTSGAGSFSTGPHLHFEVRLDGNPVNPLNYLVGNE